AKVTVIERFPELRNNGHVVDIRTLGFLVMRKMEGLEAAVKAKVVPMDGISIVDNSGHPYIIITATGNPDQQSLVPNNENINYIFSEQVASMQQKEQEEGSPITVEFFNGSPTSEYDLVVACDGAASRTRAMGLECGIRDYVQPTNSWVAFFSIKENLLDGSKIGKAHNAIGGRFFGMGQNPMGGNRAVIQSLNAGNLPQFREARDKGAHHLKQFVAQHYKGAGWKIDELLKCIMESKDFYANEIARIKPPTLFKGRFVLVGDAGYGGSAGTGTSLAMTGGYFLAGEIPKNEGNLAAGLRGYEEKMLPYVKELQTVPLFLYSVLGPQTAWGLWLRNKILAFISWTGILGFVQKHFAAGFANGNKYTLPEYEWVS
ncbi:hypothetical protein HYALB_00008614, partial [Hymenoscyphus albidus]